MSGDLNGIQANRILDTAEMLYAAGGMESLTLRKICDAAGVSLASIASYFQSRAALTLGMLERRMLPINQARVKLLRRFEADNPQGINVEHVITALLMPEMISMHSLVAPPYLPQFFLRSASDPAEPIRQAMKEQFGDVSQIFDDAFCRIHAGSRREDSLWRLHVFFNAFPGSITNHNTMLLLLAFKNRPTHTPVDVICRITSAIVNIDSDGPEWMVSRKRIQQIVAPLPPLSIAREQMSLLRV